MAFLRHLCVAQRHPHPQPPLAAASALRRMAFSVGSQQVACSVVVQQPVEGLLARTIAEAAEAWTRWVSVIEMSVSPAVCSA